jgi:competence ComEA-like helix-hairpin-helix protein
MTESGGRKQDDPNAPIPPPWTASQRSVLIGLLLILATYISVRYWFNRQYVSDPQPAIPSRLNELADRIDPNTADVATLAALPTIGEKRAKDIITYREKFQRDGRKGAAFENLEDLLKVQGIGAATIAQLKPYLLFPQSDRPTTKP